MDKFMKQVRKDTAVVAMNLHRSFLIEYHKACNNPQATSWMDAAVAAKRLDWYIRNEMSLMQRIIYMWHVITLKDETFQIQDSA